VTGVQTCALPIFLKNRIIDFPHYKTVKQWIEDKNVLMEKTAYYKWLKDQLIADGSVWNGVLKDEKDIIRQYENFKKLFEIAPHFKNAEPFYRIVNNNIHYYGPICIKIKDDGNFDIWDGMHRISILSAINHPINFTICERHEEWQKLLNDLKKLYPIAMYQAIPHPEFDDWPCQNNNLKELQIIEIIKSNNIKSVLDFGSCHGHILYTLRNLIKSAEGIEYNQIRYRVMKMIFDKIGFIAHNDDFFNIAEKYNKRVDCVFSLATFHHFAKENTLEKFKKLLEHIKRISNMLIYELPEQDEEQYSWMYPDIDMNKLIQSGYGSKYVVQIQKRKLVVLSI
jgi:hypothetical protein